MFYKYEIKKINGEDCLYLFISMDYEFSNEFTNNSNLSILSRDYIKANNIKFNGKKIYYVINGIVVKKLDLKSNKYVLNDSYSPDNFLINLKLTDNSFCEITLRDYLVSVLFSFYSDNIGDEVLKAICVLFNTYSYKMMIENKYILENSEFVRYINFKEYKLNYNDYNNIIKRINNIINSVSCLYIAYNNEPILPFVHFSNIGKTISNKNYPYLSSVKSLWDLAASNYIRINDFTYEVISQLLNIDINSNTKIVINSNNVIINNKCFSINEIKNILNLNSCFIYIIQNKKYIRFITKGVGNSLGLSIYGSIAIENNGGNYLDILNYYFPKTTIYKYIKELS